ncbi:carboxypeptidase-like regulatory domain-containing protein [Spirosoma aerophilum]
MTEFRCLVTTVSGLPIVDAAIRLLNALGTDVTGALFGKTPVYTRENGVYSYPSPGNKIVRAGTYKLIVGAPGYHPFQLDTPPDFIGPGNFTVVLTGDTQPIPVENITLPGASYVSPLFPIEVLVDAVAPSTAKWEFIEATVLDSKNRRSVIEVQTTSGKARLNLQARLELETGMHLVGDTRIVDIDPDASEEYTVTLASLTPTGRQDLNTSFSLQVANVFPIGDENDLVNFTNADGPADWLTPWSEVPAFEGHYADVMVWLPVAGIGVYTLQTEFFDINRASLSTTDETIDADIMAARRIVRVRIPEPISGAYYATMQIMLAGNAQTTPLNVRYIRG